jgi:two-component system sensor histidine kinase KdpD
MTNNGDDKRPSPEALLKLCQAEELEEGRGKLKIFLGYAPGVGKTFAMLEEAWQRKLDERDVVAAYVETHGRFETDTLLAGLEILPKAQVAYMGVTLPEMDLDAVLARKPQIALVDELAHTNAPGSRHEKRWQDVEELLAAGIDVYTTVNIQHFESLNDIVAQITGIKVRETVPDRLLDQAAEIKLVDLPPDDLLQRLQEGKVYIPEQATRAMAKFFKRGNLIALRELSMRKAAARVDEQMRAYMETRSIAGPWPAAEQLLVCVSGSPYSEKLIRTTRRLADEMKAHWHTVYIETPGGGRHLRENRERVWRDLRLAETLGAHIATVTATSVAQAVIDYAVKHNITKIVVGKPSKPRWREFLRQPLVDQIIRLSGQIDVYVVSLEDAGNKAGTRHRPAAKGHSVAGLSEEPRPGHGGFAGMPAGIPLSGPHQPGHDLPPRRGPGGHPPGAQAGDSDCISQRARLRFFLRPPPIHLCRHRHRILPHVFRPVHGRRRHQHARFPVPGTGRDDPRP